MDYTHGKLDESDMLADPVAQFARWFAEAEGAGLLQPNAMTLATADAAGAPSARIVLLKEFDPQGFVFFTNHDSRKGRELTVNPQASLLFFWEPLERQVRIEGSAEVVDRAASEKYFHSRPRAAQIAAWVSQQSSVIASRMELEQKYAQLASRFGEDPVPLPDFWGGYRIVPRAFEFWQGRVSRLHDRLLYSRDGDSWSLRRLSP